VVSREVGSATPQRFGAARFRSEFEAFVNSSIAAQAATMSGGVRRESAPVAPRLLKSDNAVTTFAAAPMREADARHWPSDAARGERELATR
jgi:hypothetical protein